MYFHVVYGGKRRRYGGAGRNSLIITPFPNLVAIHVDTTYMSSTYIENLLKMYLQINVFMNLFIF